MDNREWVYGWYGKYPFGRWPLKNCIIPFEEAENGFIERVEIYPTTIEQYTGLTDKNGVKIFEGDIVRERLKGLEEAFHCVCLDYGRVFWYQKTARFLRTAAVFSDDCQEMTEHHEYEVVGNIYDNPELLEEVAKWTPPPA